MLVVETGEGLPNATSYASIDSADAYHIAYGNDAWFDLSTDEKEVLLRRASRDLDLLLGSVYDSAPLTTTQAFLWPRKEYINTLGNTITGLPLLIANATAELALLLTKMDFFAPTVDEGNVKVKIRRVGTLVDHTEYFTPGFTRSTQLRRIRVMLAPLISSGHGLYTDVVRG